MPPVGYGSGNSAADRLANIEAMLFNAPGGGYGPLLSLASQVAAGSADAITIKQGIVAVVSGGVNAMTLAQPIAGAVAAGGDDFKVLRIITLAAHAHTVKTAADGINGADDTATFASAICNQLALMAYNGVWYVLQNVGITLTEV